MPAASVDLLLSRHAEGEWRHLIRPWLQRSVGRLERALVVVPTRGQAHALKQRCLEEGVALMGVEFLTPGLARKKWLALGDETSPPILARPTIGRELLLLGLRVLIDECLAPLVRDDPERGLWMSLASDLERALDDFDDLLGAGFRAADFPFAPVAEVFSALTAWAEGLGYALAPLQAEAAALTPVPPEAPFIGGRLLLLAGGPEGWGEFFNLAALARRCPELTVVIPEPELRGRKALDEAWIEVWQALLGVEARLLDWGDLTETCEGVASLWTGAPGQAGRQAQDGTAETARRAELIVGRTRADEVARVAERIGGLLAEGAETVAVIFPRADAASLALARSLAERGIPFADLVGNPGWASVDVQIQHALVDFYARGCRLEELLDLWPLLRALDFVALTAGEARDVCERVFGEVQNHALAAAIGRLAAGESSEWREVARVAALLLPEWPERMTPAEGLARFEGVRDRFKLAAPPGWSALADFAARATEPVPAPALLDAIRAFLPESAPGASERGRGGFARVTLTTRRRASGVAWSHAIWMESNAGVWPERRESSGWLGDGPRQALAVSGRFSLGLFTGEDRSVLERRLCAAIARDTRRTVILSAALFDEEDPEARMAPNAWFERVLWSLGPAAAAAGLEGAFERRAGTGTETAPTAHPGRPDEKAAAVGVGEARTAENPTETWAAVWHGRRDPRRPFDEHFFAAPAAERRPLRLTARLIERGVQDPVELWFGAVLKLSRVEWRPLQRARPRALGQFAHQVLAEALRGPPVEEAFRRLPSPDESQAALELALAELRGRWPADRYWDSFHAELAAMAADLLAQAHRLLAGPFVAVEVSLPRGATVAAGPGRRIAVHGRIDLALADRPGWAGARVDIVDFKTGSDSKLSAQKMGATGASLQLGIYLAAAASLGIAEGSVWMLRPGAPASSLHLSELDPALALMERLGRHLETGVYGALTPDATEFVRGFEWPLACAPIGFGLLESKFAATFASDPGPPPR